jgi:hypothetical protein
MLLHRVVLEGLPKALNGRDPSDLQMTISDMNGERLYNSSANVFPFQLVKGCLIIDTSHDLVPLEEDIKFNFLVTNTFNKVKLFHFWLNTRYMELSHQGERPHIRIFKDELDKACKDKKHKKFPAKFAVRVEFSHSLLTARKAAEWKTYHDNAGKHGGILLQGVTHSDLQSTLQEAKEDESNVSEAGSEPLKTRPPAFADFRSAPTSSTVDQATPGPPSSDDSEPDASDLPPLPPQLQVTPPLPPLPRQLKNTTGKQRPNFRTRTPTLQAGLTPAVPQIPQNPQ